MARGMRRSDKPSASMSRSLQDPVRARTDVAGKGRRITDAVAAEDAASLLPDRSPGTPLESLSDRFFAQVFAAIGVFRFQWMTQRCKDPTFGFSALDTCRASNYGCCHQWRAGLRKPPARDP